MASNRGPETDPSAECKTRPTTHQIYHSDAASNTGVTPWDYRDEKQNCVVQAEDLEEFVSMDIETDILALQPGPSQYPVPREELYKRCKWFDDAEELVDTSAALSPPQTNQRRLSPKQVYRRLKSKRQLSTPPINNLDNNKKEVEFSPQKPVAATQKTKSQFAVPVCLPPGCVPSNVTVHLTREETQPGKEVKVTIQPDEQLDRWMEDICEQINFGKPQMMSAVLETDITIVHDLGEDGLSENVAASSAFNCFQKSQKAPFRRNAICEELEMLTGFVKVNGAKFSLWHLRKELLNILKLGKI